MSNAGVKSRQPVIGDAFDLETYGRPSPGRPSTARAKSPVRGKTVEAPARRREIAPLASAAAMSESAPASEAAQSLDNEAYELRLAQGSADQSAARAEAVRTVKIRGQATPARRRPAVQIERYDRHPDRAAQWALFLGVFMVVVAIVTGT